MDCASATHVGHVRARNEDALFVDPDRGLFVVADGLGGHPAGDVASTLAVRELDASLPAEALDGDPATLARAVETAHARILADAAADPAHDGMGTTLVALHVAGEERTACLATVGDSRAYRLRDGRLEQLSVDDVFSSLFGRTLTQALGTGGPLEVRTATLGLQPGDRLLLCTDGLTDMVTDEVLASLLADGGPPRRTCDLLVASALDHGGYDNVTLVVVEVGA